MLDTQWGSRRSVTCMIPKTIATYQLLEENKACRAMQRKLIRTQNQCYITLISGDGQLASLLRLLTLSPALNVRHTFNSPWVTQTKSL